MHFAFNFYIFSLRNEYVGRLTLGVVWIFTHVDSRNRHHAPMTEGARQPHPPPPAALPPPQSSVTTYFLHYYNFAFSVCHIDGILYYITFLVL